MAMNDWIMTGADVACSKKGRHAPTIQLYATTVDSADSKLDGDDCQLPTHRTSVNRAESTQP